jgi:5'-deoxynucleotidase YfbR-like HD superfamily hydrolase
MLNKIPVQWSDEQVMEEGRALRVAYKLKRTLRYNTSRDLTVHSESVAEHKFALFFLSEYFLLLEDPANELDYRTVHRIILYHDFPEISHGDIPYLLKTVVHEKREREAAPGVFASLPPSMRQIAQESWEAYERRESPEALFVYALDKVEPVFELFDPINEQTPIHLHQTYESHMGKKLAATKNYPYMRKFVEVMSEDMLQRGVFWKES